MVYKNLTVSSNRIGDLNIPNVTATTDADGNVTYTTTATEGTWTNINQDLASMLGISEGSPALWRKAQHDCRYSSDWR